MQTLGLSSAPQPTDGLFKRLFWPTIENESDLDLVSVQGFWVCTLVGVFSFAVLLFQQHWIFAVLILLTYVLGGAGVREQSIGAAVLMFLCYTLDRLSGFFMGQPPIGLLPIAGFLLLLSNVRATILASRWRKRETSTDRIAHERPRSTVLHRIASDFPGKVWPGGRWIFYPAAALTLALTILGIAMYPRIRARQLEQQQQVDQQVIEVAPAQK